MQFRRVDALPPYAFAEIERLTLKLRRAGEDVIDLGFGNPDVPPPEVAVEKLREAALLPRNHRYSSSRGLPKLREATRGGALPAQLSFLLEPCPAEAPRGDLRSVSRALRRRPGSGDRGDAGA